MLKQKYSFLALAVIMMAGFVLSANAQVDGEPEERETTTGAIFTRDTSYPDLGEAWRDPDGLVWGDIVTDLDEYLDEYIDYVNHADATSYCALIGARLPSRNEFIRLREYMGADPETRDGYSPEGYIPQVLPNLRGDAFWLSSLLSNDRPDQAYYFDGSWGDIWYAYRNNNCAFRCVVGP